LYPVAPPPATRGHLLHPRSSPTISSTRRPSRPSPPSIARHGHLLHPLAPPATRRGHLDHPPRPPPADRSHLRRTVAATSATRHGHLHHPTRTSASRKDWSEARFGRLQITRVTPPGCGKDFSQGEEKLEGA
jgi:hypothetical protein